jgi:hypothetical protein
MQTGLERCGSEKVTIKTFERSLSTLRSKMEYHTDGIF